MLTNILIGLVVVVALLPAINFLSYRIMGGIIRNRKEKWDLNICCGKTDGGGVNVDIVNHADVPNLVVVDDIYNLPFSTNQFDNVLCSHTIEHVEDPQAFFDELDRVAKEVTLVIPPLWDLSAVLNIVEHRWIFLTFRKEHNQVPKHIELPFSRAYQERKGQKIRA